LCIFLHLLKNMPVFSSWSFFVYFMLVVVTSAIDLSIFKMAAVRHLGIVLLSYETTHEVAVAGRSYLSNFMSV